MFASRGIALVVILTLVAAARAYTPAEEQSIRRVAEAAEGIEAAGAALAPGVLSSTSRTLLPLLRAAETDEVKNAMAWLAQRRLLPDAGASRLLREGHEACGPYRHITRTLFKRGVVSQPAPFYLYRPDAGDYVIGGMFAPGIVLEALVRREDAVLAATTHDGRVVFLAEKALRLTPGPMAATGPRVTLTERAGDAYTYHAIRVGQALVHLVRVDLDRLGMGVALAPYYNALSPGGERTLPVDALARKAGARVAINGTFFIDKSSHPQYGFPIGSFMIGGQLAWNLSSAQLLRFERCYAAFTDGGRLVIGHTPLSGAEIRQKNLQYAFDPAKLHGERIVALGTGFGWLAKDGNPEAWRAFAGKQFDASYYSVNSRRARSLVGVSADGRHAFVVAEEEGSLSPVPMSMPELSGWVVKETRASDLVFLDGGGSTQLVIEGKNVTSAFDGSYRKNSTAVVFTAR